MSDPRNEARHRIAVTRRAMRAELFRVMPANWRERRALRRMTVRGEMWPVPGLPDVWTALPPAIRAKHPRLQP